MKKRRIAVATKMWCAVTEAATAPAEGILPIYVRFSCFTTVMLCASSVRETFSQFSGVVVKCCGDYEVLIVHIYDK